MSFAKRPGIRLDGVIVYLGTAQATLYAAPLSTIGEIQCITVHNEGATDKTYDLILTRNGVSVHLSPTAHAIPGYSIWTYNREEISHYLRGGEADKIEGYASSANVVKVVISMLQIDINARPRIE